MTRKQSVFVASATLLLGLFLYQNCGPQKAAEFNGTENQNNNQHTGGDSPNDTNKTSTSESQNFTILQNNSLTLTANASTYMVFSDGACLWSFTDASNAVQTFQNPSNSLIIQNIQVAQGGLYRLVCENLTRIHTFKFQVNVLVGGTSPSPNPTPGPTPAPVEDRRTGTLYYDGKVAQQSGYTNPKPNLNRAEADAACAEGWAIVKRKGGSKSKTKCMWGADKIGPI